VLPYGQTLSRSSYPALWTIVQDEIANGNTFFNNGNGSTTFGIGDLRGRVVAGKDNMGGSTAGRLTSASDVIGTTLGAAGGAQLVQLSRANLPAFKPTLTVTDPGHAHVDTGSGSINAEPGSGGIDVLRTSGTHVTESNTTGISVAFTDNLGSGLAHNNVQPTLICNFLLYVGA
jgi:microcystin-dependent protein